MVQEWVSTGTAPVPHLSGPAAGPFVSEQSRLEHQSGTSEHCQSPGRTGPPREQHQTPPGFHKGLRKWVREAHGQWEDSSQEAGFQAKMARVLVDDSRC